MPIWRVTLSDKNVSFGQLTRRTLMVHGCNEPFKGRFWCPRRRWFQSSPCPFANRHECGMWSRMCGNL